MLGEAGTFADIASIAILAVCAGALTHCLLTPARYFAAVGQVGKWSWFGLLLAATAAQILVPLFPSSVMSRFLVWGWGAQWQGGQLLAGFGVIAVAIYLVDTRGKIARLRAEARRRRASRTGL